MSPSRAKPPARKASPPIEYSLLLTATLCLLALGAVMVFSASSAKSVLIQGGGDGAYYLKRMLLFAGVGLLLMRFASIRGVRVARAMTPALLAISIFLLFAVLLPGVGQTVNGAQRWIGGGLLQFQPSEFAKVTLILYGAHLLADEPKRVRSLRTLMPLLVVSGLAMALMAKQPDLGTTMVSGFAIICVLVAAGVRMRTLAPVAIGLCVVALVVVAIHPYQQARLTSFVNPSADAGGAGFQGTQATIAVGSGGIFGVGLGESVQKAFYLPEAHTDMIAAVLGEETGLAGFGVLIGLFGMFGYAGLRAAHKARDRYSKLLAAGLTCLIMGQASINLFAVLGLAPLTGVPLPFVSYGGSSLVVTLISAGLILNVARGPTAAAGAGRRGGQRSARTAAAGGGARLRLLDGEGYSLRRKRTERDTGRDSGRRHRRARGAGDGRRRRAAR